VPTTTSLVEAVQARARTHAIGTGDELIDSLRTELLAVLDANARRELVWVEGEPNVWMFVGVIALTIFTASVTLSRGE
jgi:signal recognition particle GTPase